jgi:hypothetical protein
MCGAGVNECAWKSMSGLCSCVRVRGWVSVMCDMSVCVCVWWRIGGRRRSWRLHCWIEVVIQVMFWAGVDKKERREILLANIMTRQKKNSDNKQEVSQSC